MTIGRWLIAGTALDQPYPCRCNERPEWAKDCSPAWCPCAGRTDREHVPASCCSWRVTPAMHVAAMQAWRAEKARREAQERES